MVMGTFSVELNNSLLPRAAPAQLRSAVSTSFCLKQTGFIDLGYIIVFVFS